ncbi:MAG: peptidoglycan-binding protein [Parcubacteria group bacterium]
MKTTMKIKYLAVALLFIASTTSAATLTLSPSSGTYASGSTFTVNVLLDTTGAQIDGVDVRYLRFNPNLLQVVDANTSASGIQVTPGTLMPMTLTNTVDNIGGLITFSQLVAGGQHYQGSGTLLSITFRAVSGGSPTITFDAVSGRTTDTNVASNGGEVLTSAGSATFTISGAVTPTGAMPAPVPVTPIVPNVAGSPTTPTTPTSPVTTNGSLKIYLTRTLSVGSTGTDVTNLQNFLIATGYLAAGNNIGSYGKLTRTAVQKYQCAKGLTCSGTEATTGYGMVGAKTRALLAGGTSAPVTTPSTPTGSLALNRTVYMGAKGADIVSLQNFLIAKGYLTAGSNSGFFGQLTKTAVQKFQCEKMGICSGSEGTTGYGLVGAKTRAAMTQ